MSAYPKHTPVLLLYYVSLMTLGFVRTLSILVVMILFQILATAEHHIYDKLGTVTEALYVAFRYDCLGQHSLRIRYVIEQLLIVSRQPFLQCVAHLQQLQTSLCVVGLFHDVMLTRYDVSIV